MSFVPASIRCFRFIGYRFDEASATASFDYAFDDAHYFTEQLSFPGARLEPSRQAALDRVLRELHLVAGISYYKAAVPPEIRVESGPLDRDTANFLETLYLHGLGEFAFRNGLDLRGRIRFPVESGEAPASAAAVAPGKGILLPLGGGKDSLVSLDILRAAGQAVTLFSVGNPPVIRAVAERAGLPHRVVQRSLSPALLELNRQGAFNGHVPISAIIAYILAASALLYGFDTVVMSNERSAEVGNLRLGDFEVNHQYSKSLAFERAVSRRFALLTPGLRYFSLLRPLSELDIARLFARNSTFDTVFSSCNGNYKLHGQAQSSRWCCDCPKCRFVFLALAPFMDKKRLIGIFGHNLLDDAAQQAGFWELIGHGGHKPFECVGEIEESLAAFYLLAQRPEWRETLLVGRFAGEILPGLDAPEKLLEDALSLSSRHAVPAEFMAMLEAYRDAA